MNHPAHPDINLLDGQFYARDPHRHFTWVRAHTPVFWDGNVWGVGLHDDITRISKDPDTFCSRHSSRPDSLPIPSMINLDDPDHKRWRSLVNKGCTPRRVQPDSPDKLK